MKTSTNRNWYMICTTKNMENKVAATLSKKGIEVFAPATITDKKVSATKCVAEVKPLFTSTVFAYMNEAEIAVAKKQNYVTNLAYFKANYAVISTEEINTIKNITTEYNKVSVAKTTINTNGTVQFTFVAEKTTPVVKMQNAGFTVAKRVAAAVAMIFFAGI